MRGVTARLLRLDPSDTVAIPLTDLAAGVCVDGIVARQDIPALHKIALVGKCSLGAPRRGGRR